MSEAVVPVRSDADRLERAGDAARIRRRYAAERRFRLLGLGAILLSAGFLAFLLITMFGNGMRGFTQTEVRLDVDFPRSSLFLDPAALQRLRRRAGARQRRFRPRAERGGRGAIWRRRRASSRKARGCGCATPSATIPRSSRGTAALVAAGVDRDRRRRQGRRRRRGGTGPSAARRTRAGSGPASTGPS